MIAFISNNYASFSLFLFVKMYDAPFLKTLSENAFKNGIFIRRSKKDAL